MKGIWKKLVAGIQICALAGSMVFPQVMPLQVQAAAEEEQVPAGREILNFNSDWGFYRGDLEGAQEEDYNDEAFANVTLPHTMRLEKKHCNGGNGSYKGIGWYRRYFTLGEEYRGKKINVDFEGVMIDSEVYLNGELVDTRNGGYVGFSVDISDKIRFGETNVLAVRVSSEDNPDTPPGKAGGEPGFPLLRGHLPGRVPEDYRTIVHIGSTAGRKSGKRRRVCDVSSGDGGGSFGTGKDPCGERTGTNRQSPRWSRY